MQAYIPTKSELDSVVSQAVERAMRQLVPELIHKATRKEYFTKQEVKELTGWSDGSLQHLRDTRQIPFVKHGKKILYPYDGMMEFFEKCHIKPIR
ncbi:MAG: phage hypothetical protein [Bacteroidetes bacterium HLUCCA01]|nr:MAG: phage hypothetical protein [Bacteroidetes bacterium HLUCCA01]